MQARYFSFFWPLALSSLIFASGNQFRNAALARYPDAARELSTYAYAFSAYVVLWSANNFVPQVANAYARSRRGLQVALTTVIGINAITALGLAMIGMTSAGGKLLSLTYGLQDDVLVAVQTYACWLAPLLMLSGVMQFHDGLLVQVEKTRLVTAARVVQVGSMVVALVVGRYSDWSATRTLVASHYAGSILTTAFLLWARSQFYQLPAQPEHTTVTHREVLRFMFPTTVTSLMFTATRPVLYAALSRTQNPLVAVAALRIAYDLLASLQMVSNQFRHFFVTFGDQQDLSGKRRFMGKVCLALVGVLGVSLVPGPREFIFQDLLGVRDEVFMTAVHATEALVLVPAVLMLRNYFHARLLAARAPAGMAVGSGLRVLVVTGMSFGLLEMGWLSAQTAAVALGLGFAFEVLVSWGALRRVVRARTRP